MFRNIEYGVPFLPGTQQDVWQIEARIEFEALGGPNQVVLTLPPAQDGFELIRESSASSGYGFQIEDGRQRRARWSKRDAEGEQTLFYKLDVVQNDAVVVLPDPAPRLKPLAWDEPYRTAVGDIIDSVVPLSADALTLAQQLIRLMTMQPPDQNVTLLLEQYDPPVLLARILQEARIPARTVQVLRLADARRRQQLVDLVQVWQDGGWRLLDPTLGPILDATDLLLWQTSTPALFDVIGGTRSRVSFSMIKQTRPALLLASDSPDDPPLVSLYSLPIEEQSMFKLIMLLPIGALVVVFMRVIIGIKTSGTFMPVLIAMAFLQTDLLPGIVSFVLVVSVGLLIRTYLSALNLLLVARIAVLVVLVIGMISIFSIIAYRLGFMAGLTITFFPMIILAWTIERLSIVWEEESPREVLIQGSGSLFVAVGAFLWMSEPVTRHLAFNFPELHLCVLAFIMLLGRYTSYRLSELWRFGAMRAQ